MNEKIKENAIKYVANFRICRFSRFYISIFINFYCKNCSLWDINRKLSYPLPVWLTENIQHIQHVQRQPCLEFILQYFIRCTVFQLTKKITREKNVSSKGVQEKAVTTVGRRGTIRILIFTVMECVCKISFFMNYCSYLQFLANLTCNHR